MSNFFIYQVTTYKNRGIHEISTKSNNTKMNEPKCLGLKSFIYSENISIKTLIAPTQLCQGQSVQIIPEKLHENVLIEPYIFFPIKF